MKWVKTIGKLWENGLHVKISAELLHKLLTRYFSTNQVYTDKYSSDLSNMAIVYLIRALDITYLRLKQL